MIKRPQKAPSESITNKQIQEILAGTGYGPFLGSAKLDGYRCVTKDGAFTSSMKPVTNRFIQGILSDPRYNGLDGELIVGSPTDPNVFNNTTGPVRRRDGKPNFKFYVFDRHDMPGCTYAERLESLRRIELPRVHVIKQTELISVAAVIWFEERCVNAGYEGAMLRLPSGLYKPGRCTFKEQNIFKRKPIADDEAIVIGFEEQLQNNNQAVLSETGNMKRSSHKANKSKKGTLGKLICKSLKWPVEFAIGTGQGLTDKVRAYIWEHQEEFLNEYVTYKYQPYGSINAPRQPILKGFRDKADMTTW